MLLQRLAYGIFRYRPSPASRKRGLRPPLAHPPCPRGRMRHDPKRNDRARRGGQPVKEPLFSLGKNRGSCILRYKSKHYPREKGVLPTPIRKFFQIHGSIFKPDPSCDCGQASMVCISHCMLFFCIGKDPLDRLFALRINFLCTLCFSYLFYQVRIFLPNVRCKYLLTFLVGSAFCLTWAVDTFLRRTAICPFAILICGRVPENAYCGAGRQVII